MNNFVEHLGLLNVIFPIKITPVHEVWRWNQGRKGVIMILILNFLRLLGLLLEPLIQNAAENGNVDGNVNGKGIGREMGWELEIEPQEMPL